MLAMILFPLLTLATPHAHTPRITAELVGYCHGDLQRAPHARIP